MIRWTVFLGLFVAASNVFGVHAGSGQLADGDRGPKEGEILLWRGERWMLDMVNWHRARAECSRQDRSQVQERCRAHCYWMARTGSMTHSGRSGENIAAGQNNVPGAVQAWVNDPPHAVQIFDPNKSVIGVACYKSPNGGKFYCMEAH